MELEKLLFEEHEREHQDHTILFSQYEDIKISDGDSEDFGCCVIIQRESGVFSRRSRMNKNFFIGTSTSAEILLVFFISRVVGAFNLN
ncbi:hypothetical protein AMELA_G00235020 [Ameiurus melas]|uniref:Uncharacterized protein n=1 Tax=Ameiurus melas TaxID=219545 RepID=A0A7J6A0J8_AMEME|nr:hypothetical protein AMELA_G00235020 [Ameiurus melas]